MDILAQGFGIVGLSINVASFQFKKNGTFFLLQGLGSFMFFLNFILIEAYGGAFFSLCNFLRGLLFMKNQRKKWKLAVTMLSYALCFAFSVYLDPAPKQIIIVSIPCIALLIMSALMWLGNAIHIRYGQILLSSPGWIVYDVFNLSIGGLVGECFNITSSIIYLIRQRKTKREA